MPYRKVPLVTGEYYHIFNRGVAQMPIFNTSRHYSRFKKSMIYYQTEGPKPRFSLFSPFLHELNWHKKIADIICYTFMPNHFHFLLKQVKDGGISEFLRKLSDSYTKYFNIKARNRVGPIFQGTFKAVLVENTEQLIHLSRYIHLNPLVAGLVDDLESYTWSSYLEYIGLVNENICSKDIVLGQFKSTKEYKKFVLDQADYGRELERIKHQIIEDF